MDMSRSVSPRSNFAPFTSRLIDTELHPRIIESLGSFEVLNRLFREAIRTAHGETPRPQYTEFQASLLTDRILHMLIYEGLFEESIDSAVERISKGIPEMKQDGLLPVFRAWLERRTLTKAPGKDSNLPPPLPSSHDVPAANQPPTPVAAASKNSAKTLNRPKLGSAKHSRATTSSQSDKENQHSTPRSASPSNPRTSKVSLSFSHAPVYSATTLHASLKPHREQKLFPRSEAEEEDAIQGIAGSSSYMAVGIDSAGAGTPDPGGAVERDDAGRHLIGSYDHFAEIQAEREIAQAEDLHRHVNPFWLK